MSLRILTDEAALKKDLTLLESSNLLRKPPIVDSFRDPRVVNFSSNDYLGLSRHPHVIQRSREALKEWGAGSGASRLLSGNLRIHEDLERRLSLFKKEESCRIFSSGYLANLGAVTALLDERDLVVADRLNHASLFDAARLSRARLRIYPHKNVDRLREILERSKGFRRRLVMTDAYFSMDGDTAPLDRILEICRKFGSFLMVDEAHSTGVFGRSGRGLTEHFGIHGEVDVVMGTLSKALASVGGFVTGKRLLIDTLTHRAKPYMYTTAPSPAASAAALAALEVLQKDPAIRKRLWTNIHRLRKGLLGAGCDLMNSEGPILPVLVGDTKKALSMQAHLLKEGFFAPAIRPPTVGRGTDRIRLSVTAEQSPEDIDRLIKTFVKMR